MVGDRHANRRLCRLFNPSPMRSSSGLFARQLCLRLMENTSTRYLRGDQEGRNHGRHADKSQELIYGKHVRRPPRIMSTPARRAHTQAKCQKRTATCCSWLVRIRSETTAPEIVSSARMVMTVMVCIWLTSRPNVAEKVRVLFLFGTLPGNDRGRPAVKCGGRAYFTAPGFRTSP
jgi:hypothetical protein